MNSAMRSHAISAKLKKICSDIGVAFLAIVAILVATEILSRLFIPRWAPSGFVGDELWRYDEVLGWAHEPLREGRLEGEDFSVNVSINSLGMRDQEYATARPPGKNRIVVLGDSFGWGWGVDHDEIFAEIIDSKYPYTEFVNCSISGYGTDQQYLFLRQTCIDLDPDLVLLLFTPNDVNNNNSSRQYNYNKPFFRLTDDELTLQNCPVPKPGLGRRVETMINERTYSLRQIYYGLCLFGRWLRDPTRKGAEKDAHEPDFDLTDALLVAIRDLSRQRHAELIVIGAPTGDPGSAETLAHLEEYLPSAGILYASIEGVFAQAEKDTRFIHDYHWNVHGHRLAASEVERILLERGLLPAARGN